MARSGSESSGQTVDEGMDVGSDENNQGGSSRPSKQHPCPNCGKVFSRYGHFHAYVPLEAYALQSQQSQDAHEHAHRR